jgi:glycosyltransferase involved in cell wall biosynthesis
MRAAVIDPALFTPPYDLELVEGLRLAGDDVRLYTKRLSDGELPSPGPAVTQHFYRALHGEARGLPQFLVRGLKGVSHVIDMARLRSCFRQWRPDVIHFQWLPLPLVDRAFLAGLRRIAPLILTVHDSNPYQGAPGTGILRAGTSALFREFDAIVVHTEQSRKRLIAKGVPDVKIAKIAHGMLHGALRVAPPETARGGDDATVEFLAFGKIKPYKGVDVLIRAVALLSPSQRARSRFRVVGKPYMNMQPLIALIESLGLGDCFELDLRFASEEEMPRLFERASVVVFPYREIDASGVLMTALSAGRAIVASRIGLFGELLTDGSEALLVPPDDPPALAAALGRMIDDRALREAIAERVCRFRNAIPSWTEIGRQTHELYEHAARRHHA